MTSQSLDLERSWGCRARRFLASGFASSIEAAATIGTDASSAYRFRTRHGIFIGYGGRLVRGFRHERAFVRDGPAFDRLLRGLHFVDKR